MMNSEILLHELPFMLENLVLMLIECCLKFIVRVLAKTLGIHFKCHWISNLWLTPQVLGKVVDLALWVLLLSVTMVHEVELMMNVIIHEMLDNNKKVNIYQVHLLVNMISCIAHRMKTMALKELVMTLKLLGNRIQEENEQWHYLARSYFQLVLSLWVYGLNLLT